MIDNWRDIILNLGLRKPPSPDEREPASPLTKRILGVNILAIVMLGMGFLYLGEYQKELIIKELNLLQGEGRIVASALIEADMVHHDGIQGARGDQTTTEMAEERDIGQFVASLSAATSKKLIVFDAAGEMLANSDQYVRSPTSYSFEERGQSLPFVSKSGVWGVLNRATAFCLNLLPGGDIQRLALYPYTLSADMNSYPVAQKAAADTLETGTAYKSYHDKIILVAATPIMVGERFMGVVMIEKDGATIEQAVNSLRVDVMIAFAGGLLVTILLSFYLSGTIAQPLRELARAADEVRRSKKRKTDIPDFSVRQDEIAMLSESLRDMTEALWNRMDAIESFAADVAHELKNPLTSLKSALETVSRIKDPDKKERLMAIVHHDINRLDRLITDIAEASRVDSELSKAELERIALDELLEQVVGLYESRVMIETMTHKNVTVAINLQAFRRKAFIAGSEVRLTQVFQNLIDNALSFSPDGEQVGVELYYDDGFYIARIHDKGPGIPLENMDKIFNRFYTERPENEGFGNHSGLGLSIVKQIVEAHGGRITVNNMYDRQGQVLGCEFLVFFPEKT